MRVRKLFRSTNIEARRLRALGYKYSYSLQAAFEDWKADVPDDFFPKFYLDRTQKKPRQSKVGKTKEASSTVTQ